MRNARVGARSRNYIEMRETHPHCIGFESSSFPIKMLRFFKLVCIKWRQKIRLCRNILTSAVRTFLKIVYLCKSGLVAMIFFVFAMYSNFFGQVLKVNVCYYI